MSCGNNHVIKFFPAQGERERFEQVLRELVAQNHPISIVAEKLHALGYRKSCGCPAGTASIKRHYQRLLRLEEAIAAKTKAPSSGGATPGKDAAALSEIIWDADIPREKKSALMKVLWG